MNAFEKKLKVELEAENPECEVLRNGWPDFLVVDRRTGEIKKVVEGKDAGDFVRPHQKQVHDALRASGIKTEVRYAWGDRTFARREPA